MENVSNPKSDEVLSQRRRKLETDLRTRFDGYDRKELLAHPILAIYQSYYKRFKKTYHVQLQLESIVIKGKSIPNVAALIESMFMAELDNLLLTAGHDLDRVELPIVADVADGDESYIKISKQDQTLKSDDMYIRDATGILSSVIYGPDARTKINPETTRVLYTTYAPAGIPHELLIKHLKGITEIVQIFAPDATISLNLVLTA
jgi:DNA/RNA-binding domain of Phe-tRNA-synthetase-like protein